MLAFDRLKEALLSWPNLNEWLFAFVVLLVYAVLALVINKRSQLFAFQRAKLSPFKTFLIIFIAIITPSLLEESLYRALLIPRVSEALLLPQQLSWMAVSLFLYVVSHPLIAWLFWPWSRTIFYRASFLMIVFILGLACSLLYYVSQSIWPAVMIHWFTIVSWKLFLGGPDFNLSKASQKT